MEKTETKKPAKKLTKGQWIAIGVIIFFFIIVIAICASTGSDKTLNASVRFDGDYFRITNNDTYTWTNVKMKLNDTYTRFADTISPDYEHAFPDNTFMKGDGTRFNPYLQGAKDFYIHCDQGDWYGGW